MIANAFQQYLWTNRSFGVEKMLGVLPFFHSYGMSATVMGGAAMGATLILHHRFNTNRTIDLIETHQPSVFHAVPAMLVAMNARLREKPSDKLGSLRWIISGGAPLEESVAREFTDHCAGGAAGGNRRGPQVVEGFGLSEASPVTHVGHLFDEPKYGRIGLPLPMTECRIVDPRSADQEPQSGNHPTILADGTVGELCVRGPQVMLGYWGDPQATRVAIRNGWLHTGDLAVRHPDGYFEIVGRIKDLIITSGFNVYPSEVESVLCTAEGVKDAAVVAIPDEERGEVVRAFIVTHDGKPPNIDALQQHCRKHLSAHKRPRLYTHCETDLPRNFLGKVIRRELRELPATADVAVQENESESKKRPA
jgi:long-chain acyl-CoA synthetase